jgi:cytidylate kinase
VTPRVIAIDGPAGSGKSTLARRLAVEVGMPYVNTGAMYRALTRAALDSGVDLEDGSRLAELMRTLEFSLSPTTSRELWIDGAPPSEALDGPDVELHVSTVAEHPEVRAAMRLAQRTLGEDGAVMEGRDIGTVVFPDAPVKVFLVADAEERAGRRVADRSHDGAAGALHDRDRRDSRVNALEPTPDAVVLDTGRLGIDATVAAALEAIGDRAPHLLSAEPSA